MTDQILLKVNCWRILFLKDEIKIFEKKIKGKTNFRFLVYPSNHYLIQI